MTLSELGAFGVAVSGVAAGFSVFVIGDAVPDVSQISSDWIHVLGGMTSLGFAVWYAWYVTTKVMPEKDRIHAETIKQLVDEFRDEVKEQRDYWSKQK